MKKIVKQVLGIDVAQKELVVCLGRMHDDWTPELFARKPLPTVKRVLMRWSNGSKNSR